MKKKQICLMIAALVSICCAISVVVTVHSIQLALEYGSEVPIGIILLTMVTLFSTVVIWKGVREMDDE